MGMSGKMSSRNGTPKDIADWSRTQRDHDLLHQVVENGATVMSVTSTISSEFYYYALNIPAGKNFFLWDRTLHLGEGGYRVDVVVAPDGFTGGTLAAKSALNVVEGIPVESNLYAGVTLVNAGNVTVVEYGYVSSGTGQGSSQAEGAVSGDGVFKIFPPGNTSLLRVQRLQAENYIANLRLICWEMDV